MMIIVAYRSRRFPNKKSIIFNSDESVTQQIRSCFEKCGFTEDNFFMHQPMDFRDVIDLCSDQFLMFDEADYYLQKNFATWENGELNGLILMREHQVMMFTATLSTYWRSVLLALFAKKKSYPGIFNVEPYQSVFSGVAESFSIGGTTSSIASSLIFTFKELFDMTVSNTPCLIFSNDWNDELMKCIAEVCTRHDINPINCNTPENAIKAASNALNMRKGVFLMPYNHP